MLFMFETHAYNAWCNPDAKLTAYYRHTRLLGGLAAPLFLFLAGMSFVLMENSLRRKGASPKTIRQTLIRRGFWILIAAFLFRIQSFLFQWNLAKVDAVLRVDILNCIGLSLLLISAVLIVIPEHWRFVSLGAIAAVFSMVTPPLYEIDFRSFLPTIVANYINGHGPAALFPIFPWFAFALAGAAVAVLLLRNRSDAATENRFIQYIGLFSVCLFIISVLITRSPFQFYRHQDFWLTSPEWVLMRLCAVGVLMLFCYYWRRFFSMTKFSLVEQLGKHSLLMYWVHVEIVYGVVSHPIKGRLGVWPASFGLLLLTVAMLALSFVPGKYREWKKNRQSAVAVG